jgi:hypothetical protein
MVMEETAFTTVAVYAVVPDANEGLREPELSTNDVRSTSTFTDAVLVTATLYVVLAEVPSAGDATTVIVVADPAVSEIPADAVRDVTGVPPTVTELAPPPDVTVGVTVTDATLFGTVVVYDVVPDANAGDSEPALSTKVLNVLTVMDAAALLTVTVYVFVVVVSCAVTTTAIAEL